MAAHVYLTESAEWFVKSEIGQKLTRWDGGMGIGRSSYLVVNNPSFTDGGWFMGWASPNEDSADSDPVGVRLPPHAVAGIALV